MLEDVGAVFEELAGSRVERDVDVLPGPIPGGLDARDKEVQRRLVRVEVRREAALVADGRGQAALGEGSLEGVEHLGADP